MTSFLERYGIYNLSWNRNSGNYTIGYEMIEYDGKHHFIVLGLWNISWDT